jgi:hypothetical protein
MAGEPLTANRASATPARAYNYYRIVTKLEKRRERGRVECVSSFLRWTEGSTSMILQRHIVFAMRWKISARALAIALTMASPQRAHSRTIRNSWTRRGPDYHRVFPQDRVTGSISR